MSPALKIEALKIEPVDARVHLGPFVRLLDQVSGRSMPAARAVRALGSAMALWCERMEHEPFRRVYNASLRAEAKAARERARRLRDGDDAPRLSASDLKALGEADRLEASAVKGQRGAPSIRATAARKRSEIGDRLAASAEARRAEMRLVQTVELDAAREGVAVDEVLERRRGQGDVRVRTRDGLKLLHERGQYTPKGERDATLARVEADRLLSVGLRYRDRYEIAQSSLKSCLAQADRPAPSPNMFVQGKAAQRRAALANQVRVLDMAVMAALGGEALLALRMIAGEARTVNSICKAARRRERLAKGLTDALRLIGDMLDGRA